MFGIYEKRVNPCPERNSTPSEGEACLIYELRGDQPIHLIAHYGLNFPFSSLKGTFTFKGTFTLTPPNFVI